MSLPKILGGALFVVLERSVMLLESSSLALLLLLTPVESPLLAMGSKGLLLIPLLSEESIEGLLLLPSLPVEPSPSLSSEITSEEPM